MVGAEEKPRGQMCFLLYAAGYVSFSTHTHAHAQLIKNPCEVSSYRLRPPTAVLKMSALLLSSSPSTLFSLFLHFSISQGLGGLWAGALFRHPRGFCRRLVPFCVMVLTERTPHLTPIEQGRRRRVTAAQGDTGWAGRQAAQGDAAPCSQTGDLMAVFILCSTRLKEQKKFLVFLFQHFHCQVRGAHRGYAQEE